MILELVPLGHVWDDLPILGWAYFKRLAWCEFGCDEGELWIDPKQGTLISGLEGPECAYVRKFKLETLPMSSDIDLLQEDVFWRYLSGVEPKDRSFDERVIKMLALQYGWPAWTRADEPCATSVYSTLTGSTIAVTSVLWNSDKCFDDRGLMPDGATRFTLVNVRENVFFWLHNHMDHTAWLSQALAVFHKLGISLDEDLRYYREVSFFWFLIDTDPFRRSQWARS
ncbi:hypothetical protein E1B28_003706 [Marasmius oreades]|uniref:Uncharacterized protein n=1 Tax=Marasmius oreades TaxID=181124 RepID=A0A9P7UX78_9AGAR|nr:uncharacterized protein E1B28_003706 [Marasmius oreades]KAG7096258.1 hypothetical protein E1B28_003706 [Marasmius oreades]